MRMAIVEDLPSERLKLETMLTRYGAERSVKFQILPFDSGKAFLDARPEGIDLVLMGIERAAVNGMETARRMREYDSRAQLIFVTHLVQYAIEGYGVNAVDFLVKPVAYPALCAAMDRALARIRAMAPRFLMTGYARETVSCRIQEITCIESLNRKTLIHMLDGTVLPSSEPLYALEEKLAGGDFFRCHNAFLVNLRLVRTVMGNELTIPGQRVPVSKHRKRAFLQRLAACCGELP